MNHIQGRSWIITHGISGGYLTYDTIKEDEKLSSIDECHYTSDSAVVYTYVHFISRVTFKMISTFMERMKLKRNLILFEVFGYDSIAANWSEFNLADHIGFKILLDHYQTQNHRFCSCTDGKSGITRGMLWEYDHVPRIQEVLQSRSKPLAESFVRIKKELDEYKQRAEMVDLINSQLVAREAKIEELRNIIKDLRHYELVAHILKYRIRFVDKDIQDALLAPDHLGRPI